MKSLPRYVCALDIETSKASVKHPEQSILAFAGVRIYTLRQGRYVPGKHKVFYEKDLPKLEQVLKKLNGIIIGHNILDFDYAVLGSSMNLSGILEKSVDTLAVLRTLNKGRVAGLKLSDLALINWGEVKPLDGGTIPKLWEEGKRKEVIKCNRWDCSATFKLWQTMIVQRSIMINYRDFSQAVLSRCVTCNRVYILEVQMEGKFFVKSGYFNRRSHGHPLDLSDRKVQSKLKGRSGYSACETCDGGAKEPGSKLSRKSLSEILCRRCQIPLELDLPNQQTERAVNLDVVGELYKPIEYYRLRGLLDSLSDDRSLDWYEAPEGCI